MVDGGVRPLLDGRVEAARSYADGQFTFQNNTERFSDLEPDWHDPDVPQLWRYHLHYFDYVDELMVWALSGERKRAYGVLRALVQSWIANNRLVSGDAWHPYPLSLRIVNWVNALGAFSDELESEATN